MYIFYDFETSDKDFLGQIFSYSFILVNEEYSIIKELNGLIKPNRLECPSVGAILTNKLNIKTLITDGDTEFNAAGTIYSFLETITNTYGKIPLVGFNSSRFDFKHFEKLLLKYGYNPTFYGKISSLDILQFARYCALQNQNHFPFTIKSTDTHSYYSFKLEDLANAFECLDTPQSHDAREDVILTIELTKKLESNFQITLERFNNLQKNTQLLNKENIGLEESVIDFEQTSSNPNIVHKNWLVIGKASNSTYILLNIDKFESNLPDSFESYSEITRYLNTRSNAFICKETKIGNNLLSSIKKDPHIKTIQDNAIRFFSLFPVDWDIEYRPWAMGFSNLEKLNYSIHELQSDFSQYSNLIKQLINYRSEQSRKKDEVNMMIQCFNRFYLNYHPNPNPDHIKKYITPRYITNTMYRTVTDAILPVNELRKIQDLQKNNLIAKIDKTNMNNLEQYIQSFIQSFI